MAAAARGRQRTDSTHILAKIRAPKWVLRVAQTMVYVLNVLIFGRSCQVGADGWTLLHALDAASTADWMKTLPAVTTLRTIWEQQFESLDQAGQWRLPPALPAAQLINSPNDLDARYGKKRSTLWVGDTRAFQPNLQ